MLKLKIDEVTVLRVTKSSFLVTLPCIIIAIAVWDFCWRDFARARAEFSSGNCYLMSSSFSAKVATTLDSNFLREIPREKFLTKINTPRVRENVRQLGRRGRDTSTTVAKTPLREYPDNLKITNTLVQLVRLSSVFFERDRCNTISTITHVTSSIRL